jgi:hypothetical protein
MSGSSAISAQHDSTKAMAAAQENETRRFWLLRVIMPAVNARQAAVAAEVTVFGAKGTYTNRVKTPRL